MKDQLIGTHVGHLYQIVDDKDAFRIWIDGKYWQRTCCFECGEPVAQVEIKRRIRERELDEVNT